MNEQKDFSPDRDCWTTCQVYFDDEGEPSLWRRIPDTHRVVSAAITTKEWADASVIVPPEVKGRIMSEMFWRGVYAAQSAIIDNKEQS